MTRWSVSILILVLSSIAMATSETTKSSVAESKLARYQNFFIAGEMTPALLKEFKAAGGATVIDVREITEKDDCGEAGVATRLGLKYYMSSMPKENPVTDETMAAVERVIADAPAGKPVLVHCSTGNRAAAWLAVHLAKKDGMPTAQAIETAKSVGLKSAFTIDTVETYLK